MRVIARHVAEDGRTEFGLRRDGEDIFPRARFFPATGPDHDRWLRSTPIKVEVSEPETTQQDDGTPVGPTSPDSTGQEKELLLQFLYNGWNRNRDSSDYAVGRSTRNDWGCPLTRGPGVECASDSFYQSNHPYDGSRWNAYDGGHGGWDVAAGRGSAIYSLTDGEVIAAGVGPCNDIAVYDGTHTTVYLHADQSLVAAGTTVRIGQLLGTEGVSCTNASHVHLEVHLGRSPIRQGANGPRVYARGAGLGSRTFPASELSINPLPYLYEVVEEANASCSRHDSIVDGDLISISDQADIYIVKFADCKRFKRLILNEEVIGAYDHLSFDFVHEVNDATMNSFATSTLVVLRHQGTDSYYHLHQTGDDTGERRYLDLTASQLTASGLDLDSVFEINRAEFDIWLFGRDYSYVRDLDEVLDAQGN